MPPPRARFVLGKPDGSKRETDRLYPNLPRPGLTQPCFSPVLSSSLRHDRQIFTSQWEITEEVASQNRNGRKHQHHLSPPADWYFQIAVLIACP